MCKPVIWSAVHRAQDGTVLSRSVGLDDGQKVKTVSTERLVSPSTDGTTQKLRAADRGGVSTGGRVI